MIPISHLSYIIYLQSTIDKRAEAIGAIRTTVARLNVIRAPYAFDWKASST